MQATPFNCTFAAVAILAEYAVPTVACASVKVALIVIVCEAATTVSVATPDVTVAVAFETLTWNVAPLRTEVVGGVV